MVISFLNISLLGIICFLSIFITYSFIKGKRNGYTPLRIITWLFIIIFIGTIILISFIPNNEVKIVIDLDTGQKIVEKLPRPNYIWGWTILFLAIIFSTLCGIARRTFGYIKNDVTLLKITPKEKGLDIY
jgi:D-alanyl-lipoteichoic acid acyltransferase DltB (MBOAT superfamily)